MASASHRDRVETYIAKGKAEARLVAGGGRPAELDRGWFVEPTVFADVANSAVIAQEEIFGPVLSVISYKDDADAVRIANDSAFGLGGSVWSADAACAPARSASMATCRPSGRLSAASRPAGWAASSAPKPSRATSS
jgi:geranial dehydrogenase